MTHAVHIQGSPRQHAPALRRAARRTLAITHAGPGSLTVRVTDEEEMRRLNSDFAHIPHSTDVLSFPDGTPGPEDSGVYFGDVVIALPVAAAQASAAGHDVQAELVLLAVHGTLHLLGYDHVEQQARAVMWRLQDQILGDLSCPIRSPTGDA